MKRQLVYWALLIALLLVFQEVVVRAVFPLPEVTNFNRVNYAAFAREGAASFLAKRQPAMNAAFLWKSEPDHTSFVSHLNLYGFRDRQWKVAPSRGTERVMFVGDSFTEGFMAADDETIARGYERAAGKSAQTMNCGIGGNGIPEYVALIHDAVPLFRPRRLLVVLYANDLPVTGPIVPRATFQAQRSNPWTPRLLHILARTARHEPVARRWHSPPVLFVPVVPDPLNPWSNPPPEFARVDPALAEAMRKGDFNPFVVDVLNKAATALRKPIEMSDTLRQLQNFARGHGSELRLVYLPFSTQVSDRYIPFQQKYATHHGVASLRGPEFQVHQESLHKSCAKLSIPFLDLTPLLRRAEENGEHLYWDFDEHLRGATYMRVGATISRWVKTGAEPERLE